MTPLSIFPQSLQMTLDGALKLNLKPSATSVFQPKLLEQPWSQIHVVFAGPINGHSFLVVVDAYSKWSEIFPTQKVDTCSMIAILKRLFSQHGQLETLISDNGSQFTSETFHHFCSSCCITHV